jgi:hypothetical protein
MMRSGWLVIAGLAVMSAPAGALAAQAGGYPIKKCDDPKAPIGTLPKGFGQVSYLLGKDGKPDTTSIAVLKVVGLSAAGFKSVAARELSACRLDMGKPEPTATVNVMSEITFGDASPLQVGDATPLSTPGTALAIEPMKMPKDSFPLPINDRRIEEQPRRVSCAGPKAPLPQRITARGATAAQAQQDAMDQIRISQQQQASQYGGTLVAQVLVGIDGKPGSQVRVIEVSNPMATQNLAELIGGCRFAPGRIQGIAVPAYTETKVP